MPPEPARTPSPLRRRDFRLYFIGNMTSNIGSWLNQVALAVFMRDLTHRSFWVGITQAGLAIPVLLFALPAGALADRLDRVRLLRRSQILMAALAAILTLLVATDTANRYSVTLISIGFGVGLALAIPAMQAMVPLMVPPEELADAIQLNALTFNVARTVGPTIAAATIATLGAVWAFGLNAVSFLPLIGALAIIRKPPFPRAADRAPGPGREGLVYAWRHVPTRAMLLAVVAIAVTLDPITTLSPALAESYGLTSSGAGWIVGSWGGGAVLMLLFGRGALRAATHHGLGWVGLVGLGAGIAGLGGAPNLTVAMVAGIVAGAGYITATMAFTTSIQRTVPESMRGRVSALWTVAFLGPRAFSAVIDGALADAVGPHWGTATFSLAVLVAAVFLRRVEAPQGEPTAPPV
jgi:MFS family permease